MIRLTMIAAIGGGFGAALLFAQAADEKAEQWQARAALIRRKAIEASRSLNAELHPPRKLPATAPLGLRAGVAEIDITPEKPQYLDGYWSDRLSTGVHDPLMAKVLVLDDGRTRVALVVMDLIGYFNEWVRSARAKQDAVPAGNVVICTTHSHSSPCMLGVFGPPGKSVDMEYVHWVGDRIAEGIRKAAAALAPARVGFAEARLPVEKGEIPGVARNWHNPGVVDASMPIMLVAERDSGKTIATLVNFGNHPDVLGSETTLISADCFHYVCEGIARKRGGSALVFNRALGGVEPIGQGANDLAEAEEHMKRIGAVVSEHALRAADKAEWVDSPRLSIRRLDCRFPILSEELLEAFARGLLPVKPKDGVTLSEMVLVELGPAQFLTVPGEPHPEVVFKLVDMMTGRYRFVLGMAEDEIGYVVPAELYNPKGIQELLSTGPDNERVVLSIASELLGVDAYVEPQCIKGMKSRLPEQK